jgi:hypothetical protein
MVFGNKTVWLHLGRGIAGFAALAGALATANTSIWPTLILMPIGIWMLKGCPVCWTIGLIETVANAVHRKHGEETSS